MRDPELALETHAREELGIDPERARARPLAAAVSSFVSFSVGAIVPLVPWFFGGGTAAVVASIVLGAIAALARGRRSWPASPAARWCAPPPASCCSRPSRPRSPTSWAPPPASAPSAERPRAATSPT